MNCKGCYEFKTECCADVTVKGLVANQFYNLTMNKAGSTHYYKKTVLTTSDGKAVLLKSSFPLGYFADGFIKVTANQGEVPTEFSIDSKTYSCLLIQLINVN